MKLQILGGGCANCDKLAANTKAAADQLGLDFDLEKVTNFAQIAQMGVTDTPALVVDGVVKVSGRVAAKDDIIGMLK